MTREEQIVELYKETYCDESLYGITIDEMEESLEAYYQAVGFNVSNIDELLAHRELEKEFVRNMEKKLASHANTPG